MFTVHRDLSVPHELSSRRARLGETKAIHHVIKTAFQQFFKQETRVAFDSRCARDVIAELSFHKPVQVTRLLLLLQLKTKP